MFLKLPCLAAAVLFSVSALASEEVKLEDLEVVSEHAVSKEVFQEKLSAGLNRASGFNRPDWVTEGNRPDWYTDGNVEPAFPQATIPSPTMGLVE